MTCRKEVNDFVHLTDRIYRDCPQYVPDMRSEVRAQIDRQREVADEMRAILDDRIH